MYWESTGAAVAGVFPVQLQCFPGSPSTTHSSFVVLHKLLLSAMLDLNQIWTQVLEIGW